MKRYLTGEDRRHATRRAIDLYTGGATLHQTAAAIGTSYGTTRALLIEARITMRRPGTYDRATRTAG